MLQWLLASYRAAARITRIFSGCNATATLVPVDSPGLYSSVSGLLNIHFRPKVNIHCHQQSAIDLGTTRPLFSKVWNFARIMLDFSFVCGTSSHLFCTIIFIVNALYQCRECDAFCVKSLFDCPCSTVQTIVKMEWKESVDLSSCSEGISAPRRFFASVFSHF